MTSDASILVLEDDNNLRELLVEVLEDHQFSALGVSNPSAAVEACEEDRFDIVVTDIRMNDRKDGKRTYQFKGQADGLGALELIKDRFPDLRCIVMTGFADEQSPHRALRIQVDDYIYKPFTMDEFLTVVQRVKKSGQEKSFFQSLLREHGRLKRELISERLNKARAAILNAFRVAIRSKVLYLDIAFTAWNAIEKTEHSFLSLQEQQQEPSAEQLEKLTVYYETLLTKFNSHLQEKTFPLSKPPKDYNFQAFFERLEEGQITLETLHLAAFLRLKKLQGKLPPELAGTYATVWG